MEVAGSKWVEVGESRWRWRKVGVDGGKWEETVEAACREGK